MIRLLKIEWHKIRSYAVFWVIAGIILLLFLALSIGAATANIKFEVFYSAGFETKKFFQFPFVWSSFAFLGQFFSHLLALLIIILVGNEFNYRMMRQQLVFGTPRSDLFLSKLSLIIFLPLFMFGIMVVLSLLFGFIYTENVGFDIVLSQSFFSVNYYLQMVGFMSFALLVSTLLRSTGLSIIVYLGYLLFELIFGLFMKIKFDNLMYYFPFKSIGGLTPRPSLNTAMNDMMKMQIGDFKDTPMHFSEPITLLIPLLYISLFLFLSFNMLKKRDL